MRLRIRHKEGIATLTTLSQQSTLLELHCEIAKEIKIPAEKLEIKFGYPPKLLPLDDTTSVLTLESFGIKDGEQILTSERQGSGSAFTFPTDQPNPVTLESKVPENNINPTLSSGRNISGKSFAPTTTPVSGGFGSRSVIQPTDVLPSFQAHTSGNTFGRTATADSSLKTAPSHSPPLLPPHTPLAVHATPARSMDSVRIRDHGFLVVREVEDDNSCLFNSIAYVLDPGMKNDIQGLRQIVAQAIEANPDTYPDAVLGRPRSEYCDWIKKKNSWGGAIELAIFSEHYKTEIDSIDVSTNRVDRFGENQYDQRVMVMYSGIHYDAIALTPSPSVPADCDQTQFDASLEEFISAGVQLAANLKKANKYTDLANFTLRCSICQVGLKGEKDAQQHAQETTHSQFQEYR